MKTKETNTENGIEIRVNGKAIPDDVATSIMPLVEMLLEKNGIVPLKNKQIDAESKVEKLSPFKLLLAKAILAGENPEGLVSRIALEMDIPQTTVKAYVAMVLKKINKPPY